MRTWEGFALFAVCATMTFSVKSFSQDQQEQTDAKTRKMLVKIIPIYPALAQKTGIGGSVKIEVLIAPNGTAKSVEVLGGHPVLAQAGFEALRKSKWDVAPHETKEIFIFNFHPQ